MTEISLLDYAFESHPVRVVLKDGEPWWVAKDVCNLLAFSNSRVIMARCVDDDEKALLQRADFPEIWEKIIGENGANSSVETEKNAPQKNLKVTNRDFQVDWGGSRFLQIVNESGVYALIFQSKKPEAKRFRKWLTSEVIPQIRRTGQYIPAGTIPDQAKRPQIMGGDNIQMIITDRDLLNALWLYAIGAIGRADVYRFRFGAEREPTEWELSIDPLRLTWTRHIEKERSILAVPDADFPIPGPALSKILCGDSRSKGPWLHNSDHTQYAGQQEFSREACQFLCDRYFDLDYGGEEANEFRRIPPLRQLIDELHREREFSKSGAEPPPVYL
jgi:prophage antirepressor-like protein